MVEKKRCFLISPIGERNYDTRKFANKVRTFLEYQVLREDCKFDLKRSDEIVAASTVTEAMIKDIIDSDLCIVLLDGINRNVYYEMAVRHAAGKVCFCIMSDSEQNLPLPFDTADVPVIYFPYDEMMNYAVGSRLGDGLLDLVKDLRSAIQSYRNDKYPVSNPILRARLDFKLPPRMSVNDLIREALDAWKTDANGELVEAIVKQVRNSPQDVAEYIDGEDRAFQKLAEMTQQATSSLRTSRFAPQAISQTTSNTKTSFFDALCKFGSMPNVTCKRIMCTNKRDKLNDLWNTMNATRGGSMELHLTRRSNNFELVVIDQLAAFLHFYDDNQRIKSTLYIKSPPVIREFERIYDQILEDEEYSFHVIHCRECVTPIQLANEYQDAEKLFPPEPDNDDKAAMTLSGE